MSTTEGCSGIKLPTGSMIYYCVIDYRKLNGLEKQFFIITPGPVDGLGSTGPFSWCLFCSCSQRWLGRTSKTASSFVYLVPQLG